MTFRHLRMLGISAAVLLWLAPCTLAAAQETPAVTGEAAESSAVENTPDTPPQSPAVATNTWHGSLMFTVSEMRQISEVLAALRRRSSRGGTDDFLATLLGGQQDSTEDVLPPDMAPPPPPVFYLNSILYVSPEQWAVWVNGRKLGPAQPEGEALQVVSISRSEAVLRWYPDQVPTQRAGPAQESGLPTPSGDALLNTADHSITFTLRPHQSFDTDALRVQEGRPRAPTLAATPPTADPEAAAAPPEDSAPIAPERQASDALTGMYTDFRTLLGRTPTEAPTTEQAAPAEDTPAPSPTP